MALRNWAIARLMNSLAVEILMPMVSAISR
jgi:hypothetical protein